MTKINIQRTYDPSKAYTTDAGKELHDFIDAQLQVNEIVLRALLKGLSFEDNIYCAVRDIELKHNTPQIISADKPVQMILVGRVFNKDYGLSSPLHWYYNDQNEVEVLAQFTSSPTLAIKLRVVLLFQ